MNNLEINTNDAIHETLLNANYNGYVHLKPEYQKQVREAYIDTLSNTQFLQLISTFYAVQQKMLMDLITKVYTKGS